MVGHRIRDMSPQNYRLISHTQPMSSDKQM